MHRPALLFLSLVLAASEGAGVARAQILPLTVPKGKLRWDFSGQFNAYDWRWRDGVREEAAADFDEKTLDRAYVPGLASIEDRIARIAGINASLTLGTTHSTEIVNRGMLGIGGAIGITNRITLFGNIPIVRIQVRPNFSVTSTGSNAGLGPDNATTVNQLATTIDTLQKLITAHQYDSDPSLKALAQNTLDRFLDLQGILAMPAVARFLPIAGTAVGNALLAGITAFQNNLHGPLGIGLFNTLPSLPSGGITSAQFGSFLTDPAGTIAALPIDQVPETIYIGDIEVGAVFSLFDHFPQSDLSGGARSALKATVRLRTARLASPVRFFDLPTGDRQPDVQLDWVTDLTKGRLGARLGASYNLQLAGSQNKRVTDPRDPIAPADALAGVTRDPGDEIRLAFRPFLRLAPYLSLYGGAEYWAKGEDKWSYVAGQPPVPGVDISVLGDGSKSNAVFLSGGISYSHSGLNKYGKLKLPLDASLRYDRVARSTLGVFPDANVVTIDLRFYSRLFGPRSDQ
jgi:hypothetical protein